MNERTKAATAALELPDEGKLRPLALNAEWIDANRRRDQLQATLERLDAEAAALRAARSKGGAASAVERALKMISGEQPATASDAELQAVAERRAIVEQGLREAEGELARLHRDLGDRAAQGFRPHARDAVGALADALRSVVQARAAFVEIEQRLRDAGYCPEQVSLPLSAGDQPARDAERALRLIERIRAELADLMLTPDEAAQPVAVRVLSDTLIAGSTVGGRMRLPLRQARALALVGAVELVGA